MLYFSQKLKSFRTATFILSILFLISFTVVTVISCALPSVPEDSKGPGKIDAGPGEIDVGPGESDLKKINGSGNIVTSEIDVKDFNKVEVYGPGYLIIEQGDQEGLVIETDNNLLEYIEVNKSGDKVVIEVIVEKGYQLEPTEEIYFYLAAKDIEEIILPGVVNVISGDLQTDSLDLDMNGITTVELTGQVDVLNMLVDGTGDFLGEDFKSKECNISGTGTANAIVNVSDKLNVSLKGVGAVRYIGNPEVIKDVNDIVTVEKID